jgi:hypothetical protein
MISPYLIQRMFYTRKMVLLRTMTTDLEQLRNISRMRFEAVPDPESEGTFASALAEQSKVVALPGTIATPTARTQYRPPTTQDISARGSPRVTYRMPGQQ